MPAPLPESGRRRPDAGTLLLTSAVAESGILVTHQTVTERDLRDTSFADIVKDFLRFREVMARKLA